MITKKGQQKRHAGGRPRKFETPSRPITVTLPEETLEHLLRLDGDRALAIVKATNAALKMDGPPRGEAEVVEVAPGAGVIIVGPSRHLGRIPWLRMAEIAPARYLLTIPTGTPVDSLELAIVDILDDLPVAEQSERILLTELLEIMRSLRRDQKVTKAEILFVDTNRKKKPH